MRKHSLTPLQCVLLVLSWGALCILVLTSVPRIDGMTLLSVFISAALVFTPIIKAIKNKK